MSLGKTIVITIFAVPLGAWQFSEWWHARSELRHPLVEGRVIQRTEYRRWGGIPAGRLSIALPDAKTHVVAEVAKYEMERIPDHVRFHYSGDSSREVFLEGEANPFFGVLIFWGLPPFLWLIYFATRRREPGAPEPFVPLTQP